MRFRERVQRAINIEEPDRAPLDLIWPTEYIIDALKGILNVDSEEGGLRALGVDVRWVNPGAAAGWKSRTFCDGSWDDEWGVRWWGYYGRHLVTSLPFMALSASRRPFPSAPLTMLRMK